MTGPMPSRLTKNELIDKIKTWENRAKMAQKQGNTDLAEKALDHKRECENELALLEEFED